MPEALSRPFAYHVVRYLPNLVRDEWINVGVVLLDTTSGLLLRRFLEDPDLSRVRRLHPEADEAVLRRLGELFETPLLRERGAAAYLQHLEQTLSNGVQLGPSKGLLADDAETELDRLFREQVEPPRFRRTPEEDLATRHGIRHRADQVFRTAGIWPLLERRLRVDEFTFAGDPLRIDYSYRRNGTRGFVQALPLGRDPGNAKVLAFTADAIRAKLEQTEFLAVTEVEAHPDDNARHRFVTGLLQEHEIPLVPLAGLREWAFRLRSMIGNGHN